MYQDEVGLVHNWCLQNVGGKEASEEDDGFRRPKKTMKVVERENGQPPYTVTVCPVL